MADLDDNARMKVHALAPYEAEHVFAEWSRRANGEAFDRGLQVHEQFTDAAAGLCGDLGPPWPVALENHEQFGRRMAAGLFALLKEV